jgi:hypothetical protein
VVDDISVFEFDLVNYPRLSGLTCAFNFALVSLVPYSYDIHVGKCKLALGSDFE